MTMNPPAARHKDRIRRAESLPVVDAANDHPTESPEAMMPDAEKVMLALNFPLRARCQTSTARSKGSPQGGE
jgi:hypothetical protein